MKQIQLNPQQQEAITHRGGPLLVISTAGSGKTMVLTERIIHLIEDGIDPARLLAITFAKKAALEIQSRLEKRLNGNGDKALVCTFHSFGYRILKAENSIGVGCKLIHDNDQLDLVRHALEKMKMEDDPGQVMRGISLAKNDLLFPADMETSTDYRVNKLAKVYGTYELVKRRRRLIDFDDLLFLPYHLFRSNEKILDRYQNRFKHILIDEFQDSSRVMVELVKMLSQTHRNVWLAGDDDQSIHGFRGARSDIFVSFGKECGTSAKTITMSRNYRSTRKIIRAANNLISHNRNRVIKEMVTDNGEGEDIEILEGDNEIEEAELVATKLLDLASKGYRYAEIAILARLYRLMPFIEATMIRNGIPYSSLGKFLYERRDMKTAIAVMKFLLGASPGDTLDQKFLNGIRTDLYAHHERIDLKGAFEIACTYVMLKRESEYLEEDEQILKRTYLDALEYLITPHQDMDGFLAHIDEARRVNQSSFGQRVNLMTIHQAKGLEFKCVVLPGLNEGILPHVNSIDQVITKLEEERRLLYVGMTRAMERLIITYRRRTTGEPITVASRFLGEIG